jgi:predicted Zn-dependent peptidase
MKYHKTILPNGLRIITTPLTNLESATLTIWVGVGSRHEDEALSGLTHFLEHMVFKGSKKRPTAREISESVDAIGAEINAATSKEWTNFYIRTRSTHLKEAFDILSDMLINPLIQKDEVDKERGVILEEISLYNDMPSAKVSHIFERLIFSGHGLGRDVLGTPQTVGAIAQEDFFKHLKRFYNPSRMLVTVGGNTTAELVEELCNEYFGELEGQQSPTDYKMGIDMFAADQDQFRLELDSQKREQANLIVGFLGNKRGEKSRYAENLLTTILGSGMSSRLFLEIRERRGLAYAIRSNTEHLVDTGYFETYAGVDPKNAKEAIKVILDECYKLKEGSKPVTDSELKKAKEYVKGHFALSLEDTRVMNDFLGEEELLMGKSLTAEEVFRGIDKVTKDEILKVAEELFNPKHLNLAIVGPFEDKSVFEKVISS